MTDKVQKIREAVKNRYECWKEKEFNSHSIESEIRMSECMHLLLMLDSLQEEPVSEDLEGEIKRYLHEVYDRDTTVGDIARHFANWQKGQMMKDTITAHVFGKEIGKSLFCFKADGDDYLIGHEVKVVILKDN